MKLSQRIKIATRVLTKGLGNSISADVITNYEDDARFMPRKQMRGLTYKAIDKIGTSLSVYEPKVLKPNGDVFANHPLYNFIQKPNNNISRFADFIHLFGMIYEVYGENFIYLAKGDMTQKVKEIILLDPSRVELQISEGEVVGYVLHKMNGQQVPLLIEEVVHDKRPNIFNQYRGMSALEMASYYVDTEIVTSRFTLNYIKNSGSPSGIVSLPDMDKEAFKTFTAKWRESYEGPQNAGKTAFIRGGEAQFKAVGSTLKDIDQEITRRLAKEDVLMMFEVPKPLLGMTDDTGFGRGNLETLYTIFASEKLEPLMKRLDDVFEEVCRKGKIDTNIKKISHESIIPEDKERILNRQKYGVNKWMTINEARALDNLAPIADGDTITPANVQPIDPNAGKSAKRLVLKSEPTPEVKKSAIKKQFEDAEQFRSELEKNTEAFAKRVKTEMARFAAKQEAKIISNISVSAKSYEEWLFNIKEDSEALALLLVPILLELMQEEVKDVANFISGELITIAPEARRALENNILKISGVFNQDTITALEKTLAEGEQAGESLVKLKKRVESVYADAKGYRAERIARTESLRAANSSAELVYKENGFTTIKWFANPGACEFCQALDGTTKQVGSQFIKLGDVITGVDGSQMSIDYDGISVPPVHPQCKCSITPEG